MSSSAADDRRPALWSRAAGVAQLAAPVAGDFNDPLGLPHSPDLASYGRAWQKASFATCFGNSPIVTVAAVLPRAAVSVLAAYPLGRSSFRGSSARAAYFLSGLMLPIRLGILPIFYLLAALHMVGLADRPGAGVRGQWSAFLDVYADQLLPAITA